MSNVEQAFQRFMDYAAELAGGLILSRRDQPSDFLYWRSTLGCTSSEVWGWNCFFGSFTSGTNGPIGLVPTHTHTTNRSGLCFTSVGSNKTWSFALSLGCLWYSQIYFFCYIKCETLWEGKNSVSLGWSWLLLLFLSVGEMKGLMEKNNNMRVGCWLLCSCLSNRFLPLLRLVYTLVEKRKSKACGNLFVMSIRVSHLCCNS